MNKKSVFGNNGKVVVLFMVMAFAIIPQVAFANPGVAIAKEVIKKIIKGSTKEVAEKAALETAKVIAKETTERVTREVSRSSVREVTEKTVREAAELSIRGATEKTAKQAVAGGRKITMEMLQSKEGREAVKSVQKEGLEAIAKGEKLSHQIIKYNYKNGSSAYVTGISPYLVSADIAAAGAHSTVSVTAVLEAISENRIFSSLIESVELITVR
jgi:hypothetical protein